MPQDTHQCHKCGTEIDTTDGFETHYCQDCKLENAKEEETEEHAEISEVEEESSGDGVFDKIRDSLPF